MFKNIIILSLTQVILSFISASLIKQMSFIGKISIHLFYKEYIIFRTIWQTSLLLFAVQFAYILFLLLCKVTLPRKVGTTVYLLFILALLAGCYTSYSDFTQTSHKHMKGSFHLGIYLFWISGLISTFVFMFLRTNAQKKLDQVHKQTDAC